MIVVIAGAGSSRALGMSYPTTAQFMDNLAARLGMLDTSLFRIFRRKLSELKQQKVLDVEEYLQAITHLQAELSSIGSMKYVNMLRGTQIEIHPGHIGNNFFKETAQLSAVPNAVAALDEHRRAIYRSLWTQYRARPE